MLVFASEVNIQNLTMPPYNMQSTWVGDYKGEYECYWQDEDTKPYIMHWAGLKPHHEESKRRMIDEIFFFHLSASEIVEWKILDAYRANLNRKNKMSIKYFGRKIKKAIKVFVD
jgi:hypothetical protein